MTAYPFSGIIRNDMTEYVDTDHANIRYLIERYCKVYDIDHTQIRVKSCGTYIKMTKGVHVDAMRMSLAYYIRENFGLPYKLISELVGYTNHTTPIKVRQKVIAYIKNKDAIFYPYWETLLKVA